MKKIILILSALILIICSMGCINMNDNDVVATIKSKYLSGYTSKSIGDAIDEYFNDCNVEWSVSSANNENTYTVEAKIQPINDDYIEFKPNNNYNNIMHIKNLYYSFEYDSVNDEVNDYVTVYGTILENNQLQFFQTSSINESYIFLNRIFGQANTNEDGVYQSQINELSSLKDKVKNAKSNDEARKIVGKDDSFPLDLDYLNDNNISKEEILSILDDLIETEREIDDKIENLYN